MPADETDRETVRRLLGREPQGDFDVVVRDAGRGPVVIRNAPFLDDGTPMPTRFWLVGPDEVRAVSRLESAGGVREAEAAVDPDELADAHRRYAEERDAAVADDSRSPAPSGGVGGTREGVKCLHAHYAWHLAGGDDPVGRWIVSELAALEIAVDAATTTFRFGGRGATVPIGPASLVATELRTDPPAPAELTNALGLVADHLDDLIREQPAVLQAGEVRIAGDEPWHLLVVERGGTVASSPAPLERDAAEDVFRLLATETRAQRLANPGLDPDRVDTVLGTCCVVLAVMRKLRLDQVAVAVAGPASRAAG